LDSMDRICEKKIQMRKFPRFRRITTTQLKKMTRFSFCEVR